MLNLKKVYEDAVMAVGAGTGAAGEIAPSSAASGGSADGIVAGKGSMVTTDDVLGKDHDHHKDGYLGPGCFHVPARAKHEIPSKKRKGWKNPYAKGMTMITDAEADEVALKMLALHKLKEQDIRKFVMSSYDEISDDCYMQAISWIPDINEFVLKLNSDGKWKFVMLDVKNGKPAVGSDPNTYSSSNMPDKFKRIVGKRMWLVWGGL